MRYKRRRCQLRTFVQPHIDLAQVVSTQGYCWVHRGLPKQLIRVLHTNAHRTLGAMGSERAAGSATTACTGCAPHILARAFCCCPCAQTSRHTSASKRCHGQHGPVHRWLHAVAWGLQGCPCSAHLWWRTYRVQHCEQHRDDDDGWRKSQEHRPTQLCQFPHARNQALQTDLVRSGHPPVHKAQPDS